MVLVGVNLSPNQLRRRSGRVALTPFNLKGPHGINISERDARKLAKAIALGKGVRLDLLNMGQGNFTSALAAPLADVGTKLAFKGIRKLTGLGNKGGSMYPANMHPSYAYKLADNYVDNYNNLGRFGLGQSGGLGPFAAALAAPVAIEVGKKLFGLGPGQRSGAGQYGGLGPLATAIAAPIAVEVGKKLLGLGVALPGQGSSGRRMKKSGKGPVTDILRSFGMGQQNGGFTAMMKPSTYSGMLGLGQNGGRPAPRRKRRVGRGVQRGF